MNGPRQRSTITFMVRHLKRAQSCKQPSWCWIWAGLFRRVRVAQLLQLDSRSTAFPLLAIELDQAELDAVGE
jgi:hypothetical protein